MTCMPTSLVMKLFPTTVAETRSVQTNGLNSTSSNPSPCLRIGSDDSRPISVAFESTCNPEQIPSTNLPSLAILSISFTRLGLILWDSTRLPPGIIIKSRISEAFFPRIRPFSRMMSVGRHPKSSKHGSAPGKYANPILCLSFIT